MCDNLSKEISADDDLYLASPSFFSRNTTQLPPDNCSCTLTTTGRLRAVVLYLSLHSDSDDLSMTCDACDTGFMYANNPTVNINLFFDSTQNYNLEIALPPLPRNSNGRNELWIKFNGM